MIVVRLVQRIGGPDLFQSGHAGKTDRFLSGIVERGQQHSGEDGDDGDDYEEFDQSKISLEHDIPFLFVALSVLPTPEKWVYAPRERNMKKIFRRTRIEK